MIYGIVDLNLEIMDAKRTLNNLSQVWFNKGFTSQPLDFIITKAYNKISILEQMVENINFSINEANAVLMEIKLIINDAIRYMEGK